MTNLMSREAGGPHHGDAEKGYFELKCGGAVFDVCVKQKSQQGFV